MIDTHPLRPSRRQFLQMAGTLVGLTTFAACVPTSEESTPQVEIKTLTFWGHDQHPLDQVAELFIQQNPNIEWVSPHPPDRAETIVTNMAAGENLPDLYWAEVTEAQTWGCNDLLTDLTDHLQPVLDQYPPIKVAETLVLKTGKYVGWPGDISVSGWYYRADKLQAAGYGGDWANFTWPDFFNMAAALKLQELSTFCFPPDGWAALFFFVLHQVGGTAISQEGQTLTVGDERGVAAMQIVKNLWDSGGGLEEEWWSFDYWAMLRDGKLVGDFGAAWARGFWEANLRSTEDQNLMGQWRVAPFPGGDGIKYRTGIWGGAQLISPKGAPNPDLAIQYMQFALGSQAGCAIVGQTNLIPAYRPYWSSPEFLALRSPLFGDWEWGKFWAQQAQELSPEYFRPAGWDAVHEVVSRVMMPIMLGELPVEDGMARIVEVATPEFERTRCTK